MRNFKQFFYLCELHQTTPGAVVATQGRDGFAGHNREMDDQSMEFPTFHKTGKISHEPVIKGKNYIIRMEGMGDMAVDREKWNRRHNGKLPKIGDIMRAVWYQSTDDYNYKLKSLEYAHST